MRVAAIIPARAGSKGVPGKNTKLLGDKPLLAYAIETALASDVIDEVFVSTEDEHIADLAKLHGASVPFLRPAALATDEASSYDVVVDMLESLSKRAYKFDYFVLLQPTTPFRNIAAIAEAITILKDYDLDAVVSVKEVPHEYNPHWVFFSDKEKQLRQAMDGMLITRRQELPPAYIRDGAIYANKVEGFSTRGGFVAGKLGYVLDACYANVNIDLPQDWARAEEVLRERA